MRFLKASNKLSHLESSAADILSSTPIINGRVEEGCICSRPAFVSKIDNPIYMDNGIDADETYPVVTDCSIFYKGRYCRVVINHRNNLLGNLIFEMRLVYPEGDSIDMGRIEFSRSNSGEMGYPQSYTVFSGKPIQGCGIFFICRQVYSGVAEDFFRIMELSEELDSWMTLGSDSMYVPTLLANGRGSEYYRAAPYEEPLDLPDPIYPQSRNLISAAFYSYFTSDATSCWFTLPETELDEATVACEFYYIGHTYKFKVLPYEEISAEVEVDGNRVVMLVNRQSGEINFKTDGGRDFALPYAGRLNNLKVKACKTRTDDLKRVCSAGGCLGLSSAVSTEQSDVTLFYHNLYFPSEMIWNSPLHPLYFPADNHLALGDGGVFTERILVKDKTVFAFKENRVFLSETGQFEGDDKIISEEGIAKKVQDYKITFKKSLSTPAAPIPSSLCVVEDLICFADQNGDIYSLKTSGGFTRICSVGESLNEEVFALSGKGSYMLFSGKKAFVLQWDKNQKVWLYCWLFEENILSGYSYLGKILLLGLARNGAEAMLFPIFLSEGGADKIAVTENGKIAEKTVAVNTTAEFSPFKSSKLKRLYRIFAEGSGNAEITVLEQGKRIKSERLCLKRGGATINTGILVRRPKVIIKSEGDLFVQSLLTDYRNLKE